MIYVVGVLDNTAIMRFSWTKSVQPISYCGLKTERGKKWVNLSMHLIYSMSLIGKNI